MLCFSLYVYTYVVVRPAPKRGIIKNRLGPELNKMRRQRVKWQQQEGRYTCRILHVCIEIDTCAGGIITHTRVRCQVEMHVRVAFGVGKCVLFREFRGVLIESFHCCNVCL